MNRNAVLVLSVFFVLVLVAVPAIACMASNYYSYVGSPCDWDGTNEHWDFNSPTLDHAGGATGIQDGYSWQCNQSRLKLYRKDYDGIKILSYFYGYQGVNSGSLFGAEILYWTDHDVRDTDTGTWYGWRLYHVCP